MSKLRVERHWPTGGGWMLDVRRHTLPDRLDPSSRPLLLIPGYCMNTTPLGFHPSGLSMIEYLAGRGFEVWTANLRGQGDSRSIGGSLEAGFHELALGDLALAIAYVREHTELAAERVDIVGCSLGGTYVYAYLAHRAEDHGIGAVVGMGAPLRWQNVHPALRLLFASSRVAGRIKISGTRRIAGFALPLAARRFPSLLSIYMNAAIVDLEHADELVKTVEDPIPKLNGEIARWVKDRDLTVDSINVTRALRSIDLPFLCVVANRDGIVPHEAAVSALDVFRNGELLAVGDDATWFAHADLFISRPAQERVFEPLASWLVRQR
jgi:pimeloyl-ACP methyl ester carboxylesterase